MCLPYLSFRCFPSDIDPVQPCHALQSQQDGLFTKSAWFIPRRRPRPSWPQNQNKHWQVIYRIFYFWPRHLMFSPGNIIASETEEEIFKILGKLRVLCYLRLQIRQNWLVPFRCTMAGTAWACQISMTSCHQEDNISIPTTKGLAENVLFCILRIFFLFFHNWMSRYPCLIHHLSPGDCNCTPSYDRF